MSEEEVENQEQNQDQPDIKTENRGDIRKSRLSQKEADIKPDIRAENRYVCPECGAVFKTERSLKGHMIRKHRVSPSKAETPPPSPSPRRETTAYITTERDLLRKILSLVNFTKTEAALELCDTYGYDVMSVYRALRELGAGLSVIRPTLSWWSAKRGEPLPEELLEELGMCFTYTPPPVGSRYGYSYPHRRRPRYENDVDDRDPTLFTIGRELGELKASLKGGVGGGENSPILQHILDRLAALEEKLANRHDHEDLAEVRERLAKLEANKDIELKKLEIQVQKEQIGLQKQWFQTIDKRLEALGRKGDKLISLLIAMGRPPASRPRGSVEEPGFEEFEGGDVEMSSNPLRGLKSFYDNATGKVIIFSNEEEEVRRRARSSPWLSTMLEQGRYLVRPSEEEQREMERLVEETLPGEYIVEEGA